MCRATESTPQKTDRDRASYRSNDDFESETGVNDSVKQLHVKRNTRPDTLGASRARAYRWCEFANTGLRERKHERAQDMRLG